MYYALSNVRHNWEFCVEKKVNDFSVNGSDKSTVNTTQGLMIYRRGQLKNHYYLSYKYIQCYRSVLYKSSGIFDGIYHKRVLICQAHNKKKMVHCLLYHTCSKQWLGTYTRLFQWKNTKTKNILIVPPNFHRIFFFICQQMRLEHPSPFPLFSLGTFITI